MLVCIFRFEDVCVFCDDENVRRTCWQGRRAEVAGREANLKTELADVANGVSTRCADILKIVWRCFYQERKSVILGNGVGKRL